MEKSVGIIGGGNMGESGSVAWLFDAKGYLAVEMGGLSQDRVFEIALEGGAEDVSFGDDSAEVYCDPSDLQAVRQAFEDAEVAIESYEVAKVPKTLIDLDPGETLKVMNLIESLEDLDDVAKVHSNLNISEEVLLELED